MDVAQYRRAIAECLCEAVDRSIIERYYRIGSGAHKVLQDAHQMSVVFYLLDKMVESPYWTHEPRLFMAVEPLMPELSLCVNELRRLIEVEQYVARGEVILGQLQARVSTADLSDSVRELRLPIF